MKKKFYLAVFIFLLCLGSFGLGFGSYHYLKDKGVISISVTETKNDKPDRFKKFFDTISSSKSSSDYGVETKEVRLESKQKLCTYQIQVPVVKFSEENKDKEVRLNNVLYGLYTPSEQAMQICEDEVKDFTKELKATPSDIVVNRTDTATDIGFYNDHTLNADYRSVSVTSLNGNGLGAHPTNEIKAFIINVDTAERINTSDLFTEDDTKELISLAAQQDARESVLRKRLYTSGTNGDIRMPVEKISEAIKGQNNLFLRDSLTLEILNLDSSYAAQGYRITVPYVEML